MQKNFKPEPGDKVRVSENPIDPDKAPHFTPFMEHYKGKILSVKAVNDEFKFCLLKDSLFLWDFRWLEPVE